jgi:hypothetical protein
MSSALSKQKLLVRNNGDECSISVVFSFCSRMAAVWGFIFLVDYCWLCNRQCGYFLVVLFDAVPIINQGKING